MVGGDEEEAMSSDAGALWGGLRCCAVLRLLVRCGRCVLRCGRCAVVVAAAPLLSRPEASGLNVAAGSCTACAHTSQTLHTQPIATPVQRTSFTSARAAP